MEEKKKVNDVIRKEKAGYVIYSEKGKRLSKPYRSKEEAEKRLKEIEMFKHMKKDSSYEGYSIERKGDLWQVWKRGINEDRKIAGDFPSEEEAREWIEGEKRNKTPAKAPVKQGPKENHEYHRYDVYYVDYASDVTMVEQDVIARSPSEARAIVKKKLGKSVYGYPHDVYLKDEKEDQNNMIEEVKKWLAKYLVKEGDPGNKLGKTHIRPLKEGERLPSWVRHKAATDTSGILHYKGGDYYWYLDGDEIVVQRHFHDSIEKRFVCESYLDEAGKELDDRIESGDFEEAKRWCFEKAQNGSFPRIIDKKTGEVWLFDPDAEEELADLEGPEEDKTRLWIVEWHDGKGVKFQGEFDAEIDAKEFVSARENDGEHFNMKIREKDVSLADEAIREIDPKELERKVKEILKKHLSEQGFDDEEIDANVGVHVKEGPDGKGVKVEISNDLGINFYDLPDEAIKELEKAVEWIEPSESIYVWESFIENAKIKDAAVPQHTVTFETYDQFETEPGRTDIEFYESIDEVFPTLEEAEEAAQKGIRGTYGQLVKVFIDGEFVREYEVL